MLCKKPFEGRYGCGQCLPCRINRRRLWTHRLFLESCKHAESSFVTLTYRPEKLPDGGTLVPDHMRDFLKRLRFHVDPIKIRYFYVGEYGDISGRPHYHMALFGLGPSFQGIDKLWTHGFTYSGDLTMDSAQYIAGYVTKKMTSKADPRLKGRYPEFARMSLKPGIGALAIPDLRATLETEKGAYLMESYDDVPPILKHHNKKHPLGRYLTSKLREAYGFKETKTPESILWKKEIEMHCMYEEAKASEKTQTHSAIAFQAEQSAARILQLENREKFFAKKGSL